MSASSVQGEALTYTVATPEGVPLDFRIARAGDRLGAFLLDYVLVIGVSLMLFVLVWLASPRGERGWLWAFAMLGVFLLQTFYFIVFEIRGRGVTPGKRRLGLRVMDAGGGSLGAGAVVARNVMRPIEVNLPLALLFAPEALWPGLTFPLQLLAGAWILVIAGMPLFNRRRLRVGDMVAGTIVVVAPEARLLRDVGAEPVAQRADTPAFAFTTEQLDVYGNYELQVLEDLLRKKPGAPSNASAKLQVARRIARKIGWEGKVGRRQSEAFLSAYYAALRARLEQRLLWGRAKKDKHS